MEAGAYPLFPPYLRGLILNALGLNNQVPKYSPFLLEKSSKTMVLSEGGGSGLQSHPSHTCTAHLTKLAHHEARSLMHVQ